MRLLVDGVAFQITEQEIMELWCSLLPVLAKQPGLEILFLDRGNSPIMSGITYIPYPSYGFKNSAADSLLIQKTCDHYQVDVFCSTYYTSPVVTPMLMMVYDMIPEFSGQDMTSRRWMEKEVTICYAQRYLCLSQTTLSDLQTLYPEIPMEKTAVFYDNVVENTGIFTQQLKLIISEAKSGEYDRFFIEWRRLREIQASVDFE